MTCWPCTTARNFMCERTLLKSEVLSCLFYFLSILAIRLRCDFGVYNEEITKQNVDVGGLTQMKRGWVSSQLLHPSPGAHKICYLSLMVSHTNHLVDKL